MLVPLIFTSVQYKKNTWERDRNRSLVAIAFYSDTTHNIPWNLYYHQPSAFFICVCTVAIFTACTIYITWLKLSYFTFHEYWCVRSDVCFRHMTLRKIITIQRITYNSSSHRIIIRKKKQFKKNLNYNYIQQCVNF